MIVRIVVRRNDYTEDDDVDDDDEFFCFVVRRYGFAAALSEGVNFTSSTPAG